MGSDPAPFIANLFLYLYENRFLNKLKKEDLRRARKLRHVFRFIDDLITLNDDDEFLRSYLDIYPREMELKIENENTQAASHLDLDLKINDGIFSSKLYDKREAFPFSVVRMPHRQSNMPSKMFYSTISAEVLRICRVTSNFSDFVDSVKKLLKRMIKQGAKPPKNVGREGGGQEIKKILLKMMGRHWWDFEKFLKFAEFIVNKLLCNIFY